MTGNRGKDFDLANSNAGFDNAPKGKSPDSDYVWHHLGDYDSVKNESTMQLVQVDAHKATIPHKGSCAQYDDFKGEKIYNPPKKNKGKVKIKE
ncbi:HNH endonuclease [Clostridium estertheticum]